MAAGWSVVADREVCMSAGRCVLEAPTGFDLGDDELVVLLAGVDAIDLDRTARVLAWENDHIETQIGPERGRHRVTAGDDRLWVQMPTGTVELTITSVIVTSTFWNRISVESQT